MGEFCSQENCFEECDLGESYCSKHIKEYGDELNMGDDS